MEKDLKKKKNKGGGEGLHNENNNQHVDDSINAATKAFKGPWKAQMHVCMYIK